jgi:hypothetical protein
VGVDDTILGDGYRPTVTLPDQADRVYQEFLRRHDGVLSEADMTVGAFLRIIDKKAAEWRITDWNTEPFAKLGEISLVLQNAEPVLPQDVPSA